MVLFHRRCGVYLRLYRGTVITVPYAFRENLLVGNAVLGVPQVQSSFIPHPIAALGGRNAGDGVPYGLLMKKTALPGNPGRAVAIGSIHSELSPRHSELTSDKLCRGR